MADTTEFCQMAGVERAALEAWIDAGWLSPRRGRQHWQFSGIDLARARLILDLDGPMGVNEEGIAIILHLVDQIHGLWRALRGATAAPADRASPFRDSAPPARRSLDARHE